MKIKINHLKPGFMQFTKYQGIDALNAENYSIPTKVKASHLQFLGGLRLIHQKSKQSEVQFQESELYRHDLTKYPANKKSEMDDQ